MILFPKKEYSQRMLDEMNHICYGFLESATEYFIDETDERFLSQELGQFFPTYLVDQDTYRCLETLRTLYDWLKDAHYHPLTRLHEYVLMKAIHNEWMFFNDLPNDESQELRNVFYQPSGKTQLSETEEAFICALKDDEFSTMRALFENMNFGELELFSSFREKPLFAFLRF